MTLRVTQRACSTAALVAVVVVSACGPPAPDDQESELCAGCKSGECSEDEHSAVTEYATRPVALPVPAVTCGRALVCEGNETFATTCRNDLRFETLLERAIVVCREGRLAALQLEDIDVDTWDPWGEPRTRYWDYDDNGRVIARRFMWGSLFDDDAVFGDDDRYLYAAIDDVVPRERISRSVDGEGWCSASRRVYDEQGRLSVWSFYSAESHELCGLDQPPSSMQVYGYDDASRVVRIEYFDGDLATPRVVMEIVWDIPGATHPTVLYTTPTGELGPVQLGACCVEECGGHEEVSPW